MKRIIIFLLCLINLAVPALAQPELEVAGKAPLSQAAPRYRDGDFWIYRVKQQNYIVSTSNVMNGDYQITIAGGARSFLQLDGQQTLQGNQAGILRIMQPTGPVRKQPAQYYQFPLVVGKSWDGIVRMGRASKERKAENRVTGIERVTTAAGTFDTYRIVREIWFSTGAYDDYHHDWTFVYYYSPETRSVVKYRLEYKRADVNGHPVLEHVTEIELIKFGSRLTVESVAAATKSPPIHTEAKSPLEIAKVPELLPAEQTTDVSLLAGGAIKDTSPAQTPSVYLDDQTKTQPAPKAEAFSLVQTAKPPEPAPAAAVKQEVALLKEPAPPITTASFNLRMNIIGQRKETDGNYIEVFVNEGSVLRSRDNFQVHLEASRPAYVYILIYDSEGRASQLFPDPKIEHSGFVEGGKAVAVPAQDQWFWLDDSTGAETIYVLASEKPMADIRGLLAKMQTADDKGQQRASQEIKERIALMQRGVGGISKGQSVTYVLSDGKKIQKVTDVVTGTESVVRGVSFQHR